MGEGGNLVTRILLLIDKEEISWTFTLESSWGWLVRKMCMSGGWIADEHAVKVFITG